MDRLAEKKKIRLIPFFFRFFCPLNVNKPEPGRVKLSFFFFFLRRVSLRVTNMKINHLLSDQDNVLFHSFFNHLNTQNLKLKCSFYGVSSGILFLKQMSALYIGFNALLRKQWRLRSILSWNKQWGWSIFIKHQRKRRCVASGQETNHYIA